jgi:hypothetical protein
MDCFRIAADPAGAQEGKRYGVRGDPLLDLHMSATRVTHPGERSPRESPPSDDVSINYCFRQR